MPSVANVKKGGPLRPPMMMLYAVQGIGKTTLGAESPDCVFIQTEDGLGLLDAPTLGMHRTFDEVIESIGSLYNDEHSHKTLVVDSLGHLEPLIWAKTCEDNGWKSIEQLDFGRGFVAADDHWRLFLEGITGLRNDRGMAVILLAHQAIQKFDAPDNASYDRYVPKLHKRASALLQETSDAVFFANYRVSTIESKPGHGKKITRGVGGEDRVIYTEERPSHVAKNRFAMPPSIPLSWDNVAEHVPYFNQTNKQRDAA